MNGNDKSRFQSIVMSSQRGYRFSYFALYVNVYKNIETATYILIIKDWLKILIIKLNRSIVCLLLLKFHELYF